MSLFKKLRKTVKRTVSTVTKTAAKVTKVVPTNMILNTAIGAGSGMLSGGFPGAIAGGVTGVVKGNKPVSFGSALGTAALGFGAGSIVGSFTGTGPVGSKVHSLFAKKAPSPLEQSGGFSGASASPISKFLSKGKSLLLGTAGSFGLGSGGGAPAAESAAPQEMAMVVQPDGQIVEVPSNQVPGQGPALAGMANNKMLLYAGIALVAFLILRK